jgi:hypothetical protein
LTKLARIPADVSKRLIILACAATFLAAACSEIPEGEVVAGEGARFVVSVVDSIDNVGLGNSVAVDPDGNPVYSYLILPADLAPGEIPTTRPIGAPYIQTESTAATDTEKAVPGKFGAAIGVGGVSADGIVTRGAAAQVRDTPAGVTVPFGPATVESLVGATAESMNGTDIAIDSAGGKHVVWAGTDGIYYASGDTSFTVDQIYDYGYALRKAGPIGRPDVAVDADDNPLVAYTLNTQGQKVQVAMGSEHGWTIETAASIRRCAGCPQPKRTQIGVTSAGPTVAYIDPATKAVKVAVRADDGTWTSSTVAADVEADGLSMAVDSDGNAVLSFYAGDTVELATQESTGWAVGDVAQVDPGDAAEGTGNFAPTTGVAVDDDGTLYVGFMDAGSVSLLTSDDGETFEPVETGNLGAAEFPAVAVTPDGSAIFVTWYDDEGQLLKLGIHADLQDLQIANPSPTPETTGGTAPADCGSDGKVLLDLVTPAGQVFDTNCLVAPASQKFTVSYDNQAVGEQHNVDIYTEQGGKSLFSTEPEIGPAQQTLDAGPLDEGSFYFQCDVHPTTMFGTLAVVKAKGK